MRRYNGIPKAHFHPTEGKQFHCFLSSFDPKRVRMALQSLTSQKPLENTLRMYQNMNTNMNNNMIPSDIIDKFNLNYNKDYKENFGSNCIFLRENYENILNNLLFKHFLI